MSDHPSEARPPITDPAGKHDNRLETTVTERTFDDFCAAASQLNMTRAELMRYVLEQHLYGITPMLRGRLRILG